MNKKIIFLCIVAVIIFSGIVNSVPDAQTDSESNVGSTTVTLTGEIVDDDNGNCIVWFEVNDVMHYNFDDFALLSGNNPPGTDIFTGVYANSTYVFTTCYTFGVGAYLFADCNITYLDQDLVDGDYYDVWANSEAVYVACGESGLRAYTFDGNTLTLQHTIDDGGLYVSVFNSTYIYASASADSLCAYSFDGDTFTLAGDYGSGIGTLREVYADASYIYLARAGTGLSVFTFDGATFTLKDTDKTGTSDYWDVCADASYIYTATESGVQAYSFDGSSLTYITNVDSGRNFRSIRSDGTYIYAGCSDGSGILQYTFDGSSFTLHERLANATIQYNEIWANETTVFASSFRDGINIYTRKETRRDGETFTVNMTGLSTGTFYNYKAGAKNSNGTDYGLVQGFLTKPSNVTSVSLNSNSTSVVELDWSLGTNSNCTIIERNTVSTWSRGAGTEIYNDTDSRYVDNITPTPLLYYKLWSYKNWTDNGSTYHQYGDDYSNSIGFLTISSPSPENQSTGDNVNVSLSVLIEDIDGDSIDWAIWTNHSNNEAGAPTWKGGKIASGTSDGYQRVWANTTTNFTKHNIRYWWSINITDGESNINDTFYFDTRSWIDTPGSLQWSYTFATNILLLQWHNNSAYQGEDSYVLIRRNDTYATSVNQSGNIVERNASHHSTEDLIQISDVTTRYYTVFSWNESADIYSYNDSNPGGSDFSWGALWINVFNESNTSEHIIFNIEISNEDSTDVYVNYSVQSPLYLDFLDIPYGENTIILVTADGYEERMRYVDLFANSYYNETFWLPPYTTPADPGGGDPGENYTSTLQYTFRVIDNYAYQIVDAKVEIRKYINTTGQYENISTLYTDGHGQGTIKLIPGDHYRAFVSKSGYDSGIFDWIPQYYEYDYELDDKIFQLYMTTTEIVNYTFWDLIEFNATMYSNGTLYIRYLDLDSNTTNVHFNTIEIYNFSRTEIATNTTTENTYEFWLYNIDVNRTYEVIIYLNHSDTDIGFKIKSVIVLPIREPPYTDSDLEGILEGVLGEFKLGYVVTFMLYIPVIILLTVFGSGHPGFAIICAGLYAGFVSSFIVFSSVVLFIPFILVIGVVLIIVKGGIIKL